MTLTDNEKRTVKVVFEALLSKPYDELNTFLGSLTIEEMSNLYRKLYHEKYCDEHGISYEEMTEEDFENEAYERVDKEEREAYEMLSAQFNEWTWKGLRHDLQLVQRWT